MNPGFRETGAFVEIILFACWVIFHAFVIVCWLFSKLNFKKKSFRNIIKVSNSLDPDQGRHSVGPDLDPNCLQRLSAFCRHQHEKSQMIVHYTVQLIDTASYCFAVLVCFIFALTFSSISQ